MTIRTRAALVVQIEPDNGISACNPEPFTGPPAPDAILCEQVSSGWQPRRLFEGVRPVRIVREVGIGFEQASA